MFLENEQLNKNNITSFKHHSPNTYDTLADAVDTITTNASTDTNTNTNASTDANIVNARVLQKGTNDNPNLSQYHPPPFRAKVPLNNYIDKHAHAFTTSPFSGTAYSLKSSSEKSTTFKNKIHGLNSSATVNKDTDTNLPKKNLVWGKGSRLGDA